jgi:hypothetical protein
VVFNTQSVNGERQGKRLSASTSDQGFQRFNNKALVITLTELNAMAAPATTGLK